MKINESAKEAIYSALAITAFSSVMYAFAWFWSITN